MIERRERETSRLLNKVLVKQMSDGEDNVLDRFLLLSCDDTFVCLEIDEDGLHHSVLYLHNLRLGIVLLVHDQSAFFSLISDDDRVYQKCNSPLRWNAIIKCDSLVIGNWSHMSRNLRRTVFWNDAMADCGHASRIQSQVTWVKKKLSS